MSKNRRTRTPPKILLHLARHGESNRWKIAQALKKSYSNVYNSMKKLNPEYIKVTRTAPSKKNPKIDVEYYDLTFPGFMACLLDERSWRYIDEIARQRTEELPLIFGKWSFFDGKGVKGEVIKRLTGAVLHVSENWENILLFESLKQERPEQRLQQYKDLFQFVSGDKAEERIKEYAEIFKGISQGLIMFLDPKQKLTNTVIFGLPKWRVPLQEQTEFMLHLKDDTDLNRYITDQLGKLEKQYALYLDNVKSWKSWWEQLETRA